LFASPGSVGALSFLCNQALLLLLIALLIGPTLIRSKEFTWLSMQMSEAVTPQ
jgi:hypothetical protein